MKVDTLQPVASKLRSWNKFGRFISAIQAETGKNGSDSKLVKKDEIKSGGRMGLWATCLGLIGVAYITGRALKDHEADFVEPPQPPAPA